MKGESTINPVNPKLLCILGLTSTGKTDLAISLASKLNGEIISADSRQVYKYLDIGTGKKPSQRLTIKIQKDCWEINNIKVWMYDVAMPAEQFNLYEYVTQAAEVIKKISARGKLPIIVGGTGLYIRSLTEGVSDFGSDSDEFREELESLELEEIKERINKKNTKLLLSLNLSEISNKRRLIRLLERLSSKSIGKSFSGLGESFDILKIGLTGDRKIINKRIDERVLVRIKEGMIEESKDLINRKILTFERMKILGLEYGVLADFLQGKIESREKLIETLQIKIHQFAKRQMTWFKKEKNVEWVDTTDTNFINNVESRVLSWYNTKA